MPRPLLVILREAIAEGRIIPRRVRDRAVNIFEDASADRGRMCSSVKCRTVNVYRLGVDAVEAGDRCVRCGSPLDPFDPPLRVEPRS